MQNKVLFKSIYGSHLYGTNNANSDTDMKQIHMNPTDVLLTGKYSGCITHNTNPKAKNTAVDVDFESKELRHFIKEALSGQTYAIDLLFTPKKFVLETSPEWEEIQENRHLLISSNVKPFIGYVQSQATKYSAKGQKILELDTFLAEIEVASKDSGTTLWEVVEKIDLSKFQNFRRTCKILDPAPYEGDRSSNTRYLTVETPPPEAEVVEFYLEGPDCSFPMNRRFIEVYPVLLEKRKSYGRRAEEAAANNGVDLKAYYHALRIVWQLEDYLTKHEIVFPSARVQDMIDIRNGKYDRLYIEDWISAEIERVLQIPNTLPSPNYKFWDEWLIDKYMQQAYVQSAEHLKARGLM